MFETILLAASTPELAEGASVVSRIPGQFGVEWKLLIAQIINFSLVTLLLYQFAFKPVLRTLSERQKRIADGLRYTEEMERKLKEAEEEKAEALRQASAEAKRIVDTAREHAKNYAAQQTQEAISKAEGMIKKAELAIEIEKKQMLQEVRKEAASLIVTTAGKVLRKDLTPEDKSRFNTTAVQELKIQ